MHRSQFIGVINARRTFSNQHCLIFFAPLVVGHLLRSCLLISNHPGNLPLLFHKHNVHPKILGYVHNLLVLCSPKETRSCRHLPSCRCSPRCSAHLQCRNQLPLLPHTRSLLTRIILLCTPLYHLLFQPPHPPSPNPYQFNQTSCQISCPRLELINRF